MRAERTRRVSPTHVLSVFHCLVESRRRRIRRVKYWEIIADRLSQAGWSLGWVSAVDSEGRTIWIVDAHRDDGRRFIVHADENLSIAKALPKERQPRHGAIALRLPTGYSA